jgi:CBS domain containing-hemolysin-like protein
MVPRARLAAVSAATHFDDVLRIVAASPYSRLPVYQDTPDNLIGILHTKDVVLRFVRSAPMTIESLLRPIVRVRDTMPADRLLSFLRERQSHQALVEDGQGAVAGLITLEDVVAELLGDVSDEFKTAQPRTIRLSDGRLRLPGMMRLDQAAPLVGAAWRGSGDTVGNAVIAAAGRVPEPGQQIVVLGADVEIESVEGEAVTSVIVGRPAAPGEGSR